MQFTEFKLHPSTVAASSTGVETLPKPARALTSEEVQAKLSAQAEIMRKKAQEAASVLNLPSYINPTVVNPHQYAMIQQKRKLLWSRKKSEEVCVVIMLQSMLMQINLQRFQFSLFLPFQLYVYIYIYKYLNYEI